MTLATPSPGSADVGLVGLAVMGQNLVLWARGEALLRNRAFVAEYGDARARWQQGAAAVFPLGTYWLQRFASVPILET